MIKNTKSIGNFFAKVVHAIVTPSLLLKKTRQKLQNKEIEEYTITYKILEAWKWILLHSQTLYPPPELGKNYIVEIRSCIKHVTANIDARPHRPKSVPLIGKDEKLMELLVWKAHYVYTGLKTKFCTSWLLGLQPF